MKIVTYLPSCAVALPRQHNYATNATESAATDLKALAAEALQRIEAHKRLETEQLRMAADNAATNANELYGFTLAELERSAADDWYWLKHDTKALKAFAHACMTLEQLRKGEVPKHYTSFVCCKNCGEVPIFNNHANGKNVFSCPWCLTDYPLTKH
jgi:hypothetical protein